MTATPAYDAFVSHVKADLPQARRLAEQLAAAGLRVFLLEWEEPGIVEIVAKEAALLASANGILVFSRATMADPVIRDDYAALLWRVHNGGPRFIPVVIDDTGLPPFAAIRKPFDLRDVDPLEYGERMGPLIRALGPPATVRGPAGHGDTSPDQMRIEMRMGFAVDIVGYSSRPAPVQDHAQQRLARLTDEVLADLSIEVSQTAQQHSGDGVMVFLPATAEIHRALPTLLHSWQDRLAADNRRFEDRLRLRVSTVVGLVRLAALGFSGGTVIELGRLLDCDALRGELAARPALDLAVLVSGKLYDYVVREGHPGLTPTSFQHQQVLLKEYRGDAWLWTGDARKPENVLPQLAE
jgi:hypothetical protein